MTAIRHKIHLLGETCASLAFLLLVVALAPPSAFSCSTCGTAIQGVVVEERDGAASVEPVAAGLDLGPGGPGQGNALFAPGYSIPRMYWVGATGSKVYSIRWGTHVITIPPPPANYVMMDGAPAAQWLFSEGPDVCRLVTSKGGIYTFSSTTGTLQSSTGADGIGVTQYSYNGSHPELVSGVTDRFGNTWTYEVDPNKPGPSSVVDPDSTYKVEFTYNGPFAAGANQYDRITVYKPSGVDWVEREHTDYSYTTDNKVQQVNTVYAGDPNHPSTTNLTYQDGLVSRVYNQKLRIDQRYTYSTEDITTSGGTNTYAVTTIRRCATYGSTDDTADMVTKYYYYREALGALYIKGSLFRKVSQVYKGSALSDYATTEYRVYTTADDTRFTDWPTYSAVLKGKPWKIIDPRGNPTTYTYSTDNGLPIRITLPTTHYTEYTYLKTAEGKDTAYVSIVQDTRGKCTKYTRDATSPALVTQVDVSDSASGPWTTIREMTYYPSPDQEKGLLQQITVPDIEGTEPMITNYYYDETIDGHTYYRPSPTKLEYSWFNGATYEPKAQTTSYYTDGRLRWEKDALENQTDYTYDDEFRLTDTWLPADSANGGSTTSSGATSVTDSSNSWLTDQLKGMEIFITSGSAQGAYEISGNTASQVTVASGNLTYAHPGNYVVRPHEKLHYSSCCGRIDRETDKRGRNTYYEYNDASRVTEERNDVTGSNSADPVVRYGYDDLNQITTVETWTADNTTSRTTSYTYDQLGRITGVVYPGTSLLASEYYQYDQVGNVVARLVGSVNASNQVATGKVAVYGYDSLNRLTDVKYDYYSGVSLQNRVWPLVDITMSSADGHYVYALGSTLVTSRADDAGTSQFEYDVRGRLHIYTPPTPSGWTVEYGYNNANEKTSETVSNGTSTWTTEYGYYKDGWLKSVDGPGNVSVDYTYDAIGNPMDETYGNGSFAHYDFNSNQELSALKQWKSGTPNTLVASSEYVRDGVGNPIRMTGANGTTNTGYHYDNINRLSAVTYPGQSEVTIGYDWVGNRVDDDWGNVNAVDELSSSPGLFSYYYDPLYGNLTTRRFESADTTFEYDNYNTLNRINWAPDPDPTLFLSDAAGNRVRMITSGENTYTFVYDTTADTPSVLAEIGGGNTKFYVRTPDGRLIARVSAGSSSSLDFYYHFDALGSTIALTNSSGMVTDTYSYDVWGNPTHASGSAVQPYLFVGQLGYYSHYQDDLLNPLSINSNKYPLLQLGVRYYDPQIGRFTQRDPAREGYDHYLYVAATPTSRVDPSGMTGMGPVTKLRPPDPKPQSPEYYFNKCVDNCKDDSDVQGWTSVDLGPVPEAGGAGLGVLIGKGPAGAIIGAIIGWACKKGADVQWREWMCQEFCYATSVKKGLPEFNRGWFDRWYKWRKKQPKLPAGRF